MDGDCSESAHEGESENEATDAEMGSDGSPAEPEPAGEEDSSDEESSLSTTLQLGASSLGDGEHGEPECEPSSAESEAHDCAESDEESGSVESSAHPPCNKACEKARCSLAALPKKAKCCV